MISNPFFLLSILTSAFLAFFTIAFLVEMGLKIFTIKNYRIRQALRFLPFLSLVIDFMFTRFSIGNWLNPLSCDSCVQKFILQIFFPGLKKLLLEKEISLINYLKITGLDPIFSSIFIAFCLVTGFFLLRKIYHIFFIYRSLHLMEKEGTYYKEPMKNGILEEALLKAGVQVIAHEEIMMPMTAYKPLIYIPAKLNTMLTEEEFEAVIAHEFEHIRGKDVLFKTICQLIAPLVWWMPIRSWLQKIEQDIELACDKGTTKYKASNHSLASAMVKLAKQAKSQLEGEICYFTEESNPVLVRVQALLGLVPRSSKNLMWGGLIGIIIGALILAICAIWK